MSNYYLEVYKTLRELGIPAHLKGYEFIKSAMTYLHTNPNSIHAMTRQLYPGVAEMYGEKIEGSHVERGIRTAIRSSRADDVVWMKIIGRVRPITNSEFLATLDEVIGMKLAEKCS